MSAIIRFNELSKKPPIIMSAVNPRQPRTPRTTLYLFHVDDHGKWVTVPLAWAIQHSLSRRQPTPRTLSWVPTTTPIQLREGQEPYYDEAMRQLHSKHSCLLSLCVGSGKTVIALKIAQSLQVATLVCVHRIVLARQWQERIHQFWPTATVQFLEPSCASERERADIYIINGSNMTKCADTLATLGIGLVIVDEMHTFCTPTLMAGLLRVETQYMMGLTATPYRTDKLSDAIPYFCGEDYIVKPLYQSYTVYMVHTGIRIRTVMNPVTARPDWNAMLDQQCTSEERNALIAHIVLNHLDRSRTVLVLCKRVAQCEGLRDAMVELEPAIDVVVRDKQSVTAGSRIVIGTFQKCGTGFDYPLDTLVVATDAVESFEQNIGRIFRDNHGRGLVIDMIDTNPIMERHARQRQELYVRTGASVFPKNEETLAVGL